MYRPFPGEMLARQLAGRKRVVVFEKALSFGQSGALYSDLRSALYSCAGRPILSNYILGLGGRGYKSSDFCEAISQSIERDPTHGDHMGWIGLDR
jgi:pyruvate/2-oxoacid:ferredoxin oxidoreductase alpha subunit